jgi:hypothetical protein
LVLPRSGLVLEFGAASCSSPSSAATPARFNWFQRGARCLTASAAGGASALHKLDARVSG